MDIVKLCLAHGAQKAERISVSKLVLQPDLRPLCEMNQCGRYAKNYTCPPHIGSIDVLIDKIKSASDAVVWQNVYPLEDSFDFEGMMEAQSEHNKRAVDISRRLLEICGSSDKFLVLAAGGCCLCQPCALAENLPCRNPQLALSSLEAYGVNVSQISEVSGLKYINGVNTVTYFAGIFIFSNGAYAQTGPAS